MPGRKLVVRLASKAATAEGLHDGPGLLFSETDSPLAAAGAPFFERFPSALTSVPIPSRGSGRWLYNGHRSAFPSFPGGLRCLGAGHHPAPFPFQR